MNKRANRLMAIAIVMSLINTANVSAATDFSLRANVLSYLYNNKDDSETYNKLAKAIDKADIQWVKGEQVSKRFNTFVDGTPSDNKTLSYNKIYEESFDDKLLRKYVASDNSRAVVLASLSENGDVNIRFNNSISINEAEHNDDNSIDILQLSIEDTAYNAVRLSYLFDAPYLLDGEIYNKYGKLIFENILADNSDYIEQYVNTDSLSEFSNIIGKYVNNNYGVDKVVSKDSNIIVFISKNNKKHILKFTLNTKNLLDKPEVVM